MKKSTVIIISIIVIAAFIALVYYGIRHSRGGPVKIEEPKRIVLEVPFIEEDLDLVKGASFDIWDSIEAKEIELVHQVMALPWGKSLVSPINVKAFRNKDDIYFYIEWNDDTENRNIEIDKFSDATAILFPMEEKTQPPTLMMGFLGSANIWQWKASQDKEYWSEVIEETRAYTDFYYPFEEEELFTVSKEIPESAANDLMAIRVGTITTKEIQNVQGRGTWNKGTWQVVFKRPIEAKDPEVDALFDLTKKKLCAFAIWNGEAGDRGGRKSISDWVELEFK